MAGPIRLPGTKFGLIPVALGDWHWSVYGMRGTADLVVRDGLRIGHPGTLRAGCSSWGV